MAAEAYSGKKPKNLKHTLRVFYLIWDGTKKCSQS